MGPLIHSILLIGQSNMAGRGFAHQTAEPDLANIKVLRSGRWQPAYRPINPDRPTAGVCLAESFARRYRDDHGVEVGLIPCADGGTCLDQWAPGSLLLDNAINMTRLALRTSHVTAILWHQGESDCADSRWPLYEEKLLRLIACLRRETGLEDVPLLLGGLGDYLPGFAATDPSVANYSRVNAALKHAASRLSPAAYVDGTGLAPNPDNLHFSAPSLLTFGERYYEAFRAIEDKSRIFPEKPNMDDALRSDMELL